MKGLDNMAHYMLQIIPFVFKIGQSKNIGKFQAMFRQFIQSSPTPHPQNRKERSTHKKLDDKSSKTDTHGTTNGQLFPKQVVIQLP